MTIEKDKRTQTEINLEGIRKCREALYRDRSVARAAFERLTNNQKLYLLIASGISTVNRDWKRLTDEEILQIQKGVRRLKIIVNEFAYCNEDDFVKPTTTQSKNSDSFNIKKYANQIVTLIG